MLRRVAPLLAAAAASAWTNLGPCGANGRWGETVEEKIFFLKTIKTAGSTTRFIFLRFARGERMALLRSSNPGHILLDSTGKSQRWVDAKRFDAVGAARPRPAGASRYDVALDHATLDAQALATYLPGARWVTRPGLSENVHIWNSVAWQLGERAAAPPIDFARPYASVKRLERADASALVDLVEGNHSGAFALVMLTERYDESLVLLRSIFCWRWMDLLTQQPPVAPVQQDKRNRQEKRDRPKSVKAPEVYKAKKTHPFHLAKVFEGKKKDDRNATKRRKRARAAPPLVEGGIPGAVAANAPGPADALGATITVAVAGGLIYGAGLVIATGARALWAPARGGRARAPRARGGASAATRSTRPFCASTPSTSPSTTPRGGASTRSRMPTAARRRSRATRFYRAFRFAVAVACLRCESKVPGLLPAYAALDCADFAATCVELRRVDFNDLGAVDVGRRRTRDARAEAAIVELLRGCADLRAATVCPAGQPSLCATGPVCEPGTPELPAKCDLGEAYRHWHTDCAGGGRSIIL
ncbi:hypothetical protein JL722_1688 [Aureococcus anophagefferens]|nr:hypothetical protein JL722_1688 [Aureococcus anophagefferens]